MQQWLESLGSPVGGVAVTALVVLAALGIGSGVLALLRWRGRRQPVDALLIAMVLGLDALAAVHLLGWWTGLPPLAASWGLLIIAALGGCVAVCMGVGKGARRRLRPGPAWVLLPVLLIPASRAFTWPVGWDELVYHLALPARWLSDGRPEVYLDLPYSALPSLVELLHLWPLRLGGITAPGALHVVIGWLAAGLMYRLLRAWVRPWAAVCLLGAWLLTDTCFMLSVELYAELYLVVHLAAGLLVLRHHARTPGRAGWLLLALLGAGALGIKPTGLVLLPAMGIVIGWRRWGRAINRPGEGRWILVAVALVLLVGGAWYLRAWQATGNPLYPYYARLFTPDDAAAVALSRYHQRIADDFGVETLLWLPATPVLLGWQRLRFDGSYGLQWLVVLALAVVGAWRQRRARGLLAAAALCFLFWFATAQQARFLAPGVLLVWLAAASALPRRRMRLTLVALLALGVLPWLSLDLGDWQRVGRRWQAALGRVSRVDYLYQWTGANHMRLVDSIQQVTAEDARVLLIFDNRGLYIPREWRVGTPFKQQRFLTPTEAYRFADPLMRHLREERIDVLAVSFADFDPDRLIGYVMRYPALMAGIEAARERGELSLLYADDLVMILRVEPARDNPHDDG